MTTNDQSHHSVFRLDETPSNEYDDAFVAGLEWIWGEGFLSPGGAEEVARILRGVELRERKVLDIGCGIGGVDILLVKTYGAAQVVAIDIEEPLLEKARARAAQAGVSAQIDFRQVEPGPLPFGDAMFDIVFSKDSMIHIPDKAAIYAEIYRTLRPDGVLAFSDWFGSAEPQTAEMRAWLDVVGLTFRMDTIENAAELLAEIGFTNVDYEDRNAWYQGEAQRELDDVSGPNYPALVAQIGEQAAAQRLRSSSVKLQVVNQGQLRPGHVRARKSER